MPLRMAFAGFRHGHIRSLYSLAQDSDEVEIVAAAEDHEPTRDSLRAEGSIDVTHDSAEAMLSAVDCDVVATGDYYARRGALAIQALEAGRHFIGDKPLCTSLGEQARIEQICQQTGLCVGCQLDMRGSAPFAGLRTLIQDGAVGEVHAVSIGGQHPLLLGSRPAWYFEPGKHGGTINDIGIHAFDYLPWATGLQFERVLAARTWNAFATDFPHFRDAAQFMLTMDNGCGVMGDVSYFAPDAQGYSIPQYWRTTVWGRNGVLETSSNAEDILLLKADAKDPVRVPLPEPKRGGYLRDFLDEIAGRNTDPSRLSTARVLQASRTALTIQDAADRSLRDVDLSSRA